MDYLSSTHLFYGLVLAQQGVSQELRHFLELMLYELDQADVEAKVGIPEEETLKELKERMEEVHNIYIRIAEEAPNFRESIAEEIAGAFLEADFDLDRAIKNANAGDALRKRISKQFGMFLASVTETSGYWERSRDAKGTLDHLSWDMNELNRLQKLLITLGR